MYQHVTAPLGVTHRRSLLERTGLFNEALGRDKDSDLWRRFARAGVAFHFLSHKSGVSHTGPDRPSGVALPFDVASPPPHPDALPPEPAPQPLAALELRLGDERFQVPQDELGLARDVLQGHEYGGVPSRLLREPPTAVDLGANAGAFAVYAKLQYHRRAVVHGFEPFPASVERLRRNLTPFPDAHVHPVALGKTEETASLYVHCDFSVCNSLVPDLVRARQGAVPVTVRAAGRVWDELGLNEADVLKLDTGGSQVDMLESMKLHSVDVGVAKYVRADLLKRP